MEGVNVGKGVLVDVGLGVVVSLGMNVLEGVTVGGSTCLCTVIHALMAKKVNTTNRYDFFIVTFPIHHLVYTRKTAINICVERTILRLNRFPMNRHFV